MFRFLAYILLIIMVGFFLVRLEEYQAQLTLLFYPYQIHMPLSLALIIGAAGIYSIYWLWRLVKAFLFSPFYVKNYWQKRYAKMMVDYENRALQAIFEGDTTTAHHFYQKLSSFQRKDNKLMDFLASQISLLGSREGQLASEYQALSQGDEQEVAGLFGLYQMARAKAEFVRAWDYASQAYQKAPHLAWARQASFEKALAAKSWEQAESLFEQIERDLPLSQRFSQEQRHKRALLYTMKAQDFFKNNLLLAKKYSHQAYKLDEEFVPTILLSAQIFTALGEQRKAEKWLEKAWKQKPHEDIGQLYVKLNKDVTLKTALKRAEFLFSLAPQSIEGHLLVADWALANKNWALAKEHAEASLSLAENQKAYFYLLKIAQETDKNPETIASLEQKLQNAPKAACWVAEGFALKEWVGLSPITGRFGTVSYGIPVSHYGLAPIEEITFTHFESFLPKRAETSSFETEEAVEKAKIAKADIAPLSQETAPPQESELYFADAVWGNEENVMSKPLKQIGFRHY